ncbi:MAG: type 1 glutamine amidotransferase [Candidatus Binatia bacterium]
MAAPRALVLQHEPAGPPAIIGEQAAAHGIAVETVLVPRVDELPDPVNYALIVTLGASPSANHVHVPWIAREKALLNLAVEHDVPVLGICFGGQLLATVLGGQVRRGARPEIGWHAIETRDPDLVPPGPWLEWHFEVFDVPPGATELARSPVGPQAYVKGRHMGVQFHPEVTPELVGIWVAEFGKELVRAGVDADSMIADSARYGAGARAAAAHLFDAFHARVMAR